MVRYTDEQGQLHYADTDYTHIPDRYMDQVQPQLDKVKKEKQEQEKKDEEKPKGIPEPAKPSPETEPSSHVGPPEVTVYTSKRCLSCNELYIKLVANGVPAKLVAVESPEGKDFYSEQGGDLPLTTVDGFIVRGNNPDQIISLYNQKVHEARSDAVSSPAKNTGSEKRSLKEGKPISDEH